MQELKSILKALVKAHWKDVFYFLLSKINKKYGTNIEVKFGGDLTQDSDYDDRDYALMGTDINKIPLAKKHNVFLFDQGNKWRTRNGCVVINWYLSVCNNTGHTPTTKEIHEWLDYFESKNLWWEDKGASIPTIVKEGAIRWNKLYPEKRVVYFRMNYKDAEFESSLLKGYRLLGGRSTFSAYTQDKKDAVINNANYPGWKRSGGHSLSISKGALLSSNNIIELREQGENIVRNEDQDFYLDSIYAINSYPGTQRDYNIYKHDLLSEHCKNGIWYQWFYLTIPAEFLEGDSKKPIKDEVLSVKEKEQLELIKSFSVNSRFGHIILNHTKTKSGLIFNDYKDDRVATIADVKELMQIYHNRYILEVLKILKLYK